jgi:hypothetical protein
MAVKSIISEQGFSSPVPSGFSGNGGFVPVGGILAYNPGYYTNGTNVGFTVTGPALNTAASINSFLNSSGWYVCDGAAVNVSGSPIWNAASRFLPKLDDTRFLAGASTAGTQAGANSVSLVAANIPALGGSVTSAGSTVATAVTTTGSEAYAWMGTNASAVAFTGNLVGSGLYAADLAAVGSNLGVPSLTVNSGQSVSIPNASPTAVAILPQYLSTYYIIRVF